MIVRDFPQVRLIRNHENRGFAAAVNQGMTASRGQVLLLNPDLELQPNTVQLLLEWMDKIPRGGIFGPRLKYPDGNIQHSVKRFPRWIDLALVLSKLPNIMPFLSTRYQADDLDYSKTQEVDQVMGSCFLIRRDTLEHVGKFDEGFWIWYEEVDYCLRAKQSSWSTVYVAEAEAMHGRGQSFQQVSTAEKQRYLRRSIRHYAQKHFGRVGTLALAPFEFLSWMSGGVIDGMKLRKPSVAREF